MRGRMREFLALFEGVQQQIDRGPPEGLKVSAFTWRQFIIAGGIFCPADSELCRNPDCLLGTRCAALAEEKGLYADGSPLPRRDRPLCGARTRAGGSCAMRVEPGKHRCRLHGGRSTGPKTKEGRAKIATAQRVRWSLRHPRDDLKGPALRMTSRAPTRLSD